MRQKNIHLFAINEEGAQLRISIFVNRKANIGSAGFHFAHQDQIRASRKKTYQKDHKKEIIRHIDREWVHIHIPSSIWWTCEVHHDWNNGGVMFLLSPGEHRIKTEQERRGAIK